MIDTKLDDDDWYPRASESEPAKSLQYLPLHPRFALYFATFTTVSRLYIVNLTFGHFSDFARMINSLPVLRKLVCSNVRCVALGPLPFNMRPRADGSHAPAPPFAPNLQVLCLVCTLQYAWHASQIIHPVERGHTLRPETGIGMWAASQGIASCHALLPRHKNGPARYVDSAS
ncbi:hypothetical protein BD310DRAFT_1007140 [Dichomitus squalens]|uniref:Uncharacterized protein n=1 Tax=Dichomitus squalens TaxID=114155 RepID=A0A4Q9PEC8_9APHY|nr:hypothetical protein BD310DRAFT_1007140 [Dichomitus squalens]